MARVATRSWIGLALAGAIAGASFDAVAAPPAGSMPGQIAALQAQVASLSADVAALQGAVTALQGAAAPVPVWQATGGLVDVARNDATNVSEWTLSTVASLALPAGSYLVVAKTAVQDPDISASTFYCFLARSAGNFDMSADYSTQDEPATIALQGVVTLATPATVELRCGATGPASTAGSAKAYATKVVAIQASPH
jgi:hypothetical protein